MCEAVAVVYVVRSSMDARSQKRLKSKILIVLTSDIYQIPVCFGILYECGVSPV